MVLGLLPGLACWGSLLLKSALRTGAGGAGTPRPSLHPCPAEPLQHADVWASGAFALEQGQIVAAMLLAAMLVYVIEQRFRAAAACALIAAAGSWVGLLHAWRFTPADTVLDPGWGHGASWALGYGAMALVFLLGWWGRRRPQS